MSDPRGNTVPNKTVALIVVAVIVVVGLLGALYLLERRPDASATFINMVITVLGLVIVAGGLSFLQDRSQRATTERLDQQDSTLHVIKANTNGTLSELRAEKAEDKEAIRLLREELDEYRAAEQRRREAKA